MAHAKIVPRMFRIMRWWR